MGKTDISARAIDITTGEMERVRRILLRGWMGHILYLRMLSAKILSTITCLHGNYETSTLPFKNFGMSYFREWALSQSFTFPEIICLPCPEAEPMLWER